MKHYTTAAPAAQKATHQAVLVHGHELLPGAVAALHRPGGPHLRRTSKERQRGAADQWGYHAAALGRPGWPMQRLECPGPCRRRVEVGRRGSLRSSPGKTQSPPQLTTRWPGWYLEQPGPLASTTPTPVQEGAAGNIQQPSCMAMERCSCRLRARVPCSNAGAPCKAAATSPHSPAFATTMTLQVASLFKLAHPPARGQRGRPWAGSQGTPPGARKHPRG